MVASRRVRSAIRRSGSDGRPDVARLLDEVAGLSMRDARLSVASSQRIRLELIAAYQAAGLGERRACAAAPHTTDGPAFGRWRLLAIGIAVVTLLLGLTSAALAESEPGHPLYGARLALESLSLPGAESSDRVSAQLRRLDVRVHEAAAAAAAGNGEALQDALAAYRETVADLAELSTRFPVARSAVAGAFRGDLRALELLERRLPAKLRPAADLAIAATRLAATSAGNGPVHPPYLKTPNRT